MMDYHRQNDVRVKIVRIFNTYGPRMALNDGRVVSNFVVQALKGEDITVYGDGSQTRSFCYVDDMVDGLILMMESDDSFLGPVNLGNPYEFRIMDLAKTVIGMTGNHSKIVHRPLPQDDPMQRNPDISLARKILGWQPHVNLEKGLERTIEYFRKAI
jgi:UDP-glucuronate decarboxylase